MFMEESPKTPEIQVSNSLLSRALLRKAETRESFYKLIS
jgi:hypothetical protein